MNLKNSRHGDLWDGQVVLVSDDEQCRKEMVSLIREIGGRIPKPLPVGYDKSELMAQMNAVAIIFDISSWDNGAKRSLRNTGKYCRENTISLVILLSIDLLDEALNCLGEMDVEYLIKDERTKLPAELIVTLNSQITASNAGLFSQRDELDLVDLKKISADVDRIAQVLSQMSGDQSGSLDRQPVQSPFIEPAHDPSVSDAQFQFSGQGINELTPFGQTELKSELSEGPISAQKVRDLIKARRLRDQYFDPELFSDPAWDMLLDLMAAKLEGKRVSVSSLCIAAAVPPTTALRWIKTMTEQKVFQRRADENDGRRVFIELSDEAAAGMVGYFAMMGRSGLVSI